MKKTTTKPQPRFQTHEKWVEDHRIGGLKTIHCFLGSVTTRFDDHGVAEWSLVFDSEGSLVRQA